MFFFCLFLVNRPVSREPLVVGGEGGFWLASLNSEVRSEVRVGRCWHHSEITQNKHSFSHTLFHKHTHIHTQVFTVTGFLFWTGYFLLCNVVFVDMRWRFSGFHGLMWTAMELNRFLIYFTYFWVQLPWKRTNKQRKLTTVNQKTHRSISIIDHCYWGCRGESGGGMLGFFLGVDWSVCVLGRTNHRQGDFIFRLVPANQVDVLEFYLPFIFVAYWSRGEGWGGAKPRQGNWGGRDSTGLVFNTLTLHTNTHTDTHTYIRTHSVASPTGVNSRKSFLLNCSVSSSSSSSTWLLLFQFAAHSWHRTKTVNPPFFRPNFIGMLWSISNDKRKLSYLCFCFFSLMNIKKKYE